MKLLFTALLLSTFSILNADAPTNADAILGKWVTTDNKLVVEVYRQNMAFKARVLWFKDINDQAMNTRTDDKNPDRSLRTRKLIGMEVLNKLQFDPKNNEWVNGQIYDAKRGREWESMAWISNDHLLKVKGYWVFRFMCQTLTFRKM